MSRSEERERIAQLIEWARAVTGRIQSQEDKRIAQAVSSAGFHIDSVDELVNTGEPYPQAIPILLRFFKDGIEDEGVRRAVVRALAVKEARGIAAAPLIEEFRRAPLDKLDYKWVIGNTLYTVADKDALNEIIALVQDKRHGVAREMLVYALGRFKTPEARAVLIRLLEEDELTLHAISAINRHRAQEARVLLVRYSNDPRTAVKRAAKRALARLDKEICGRR